MNTMLNNPTAKLLCYLGTLVFFEFITRAEMMDYEWISKYTWWDWLKFCAGILAPAALLIRTYTDGSLNRYITEKKNEENSKMP